ncbi:hypothetical protein OESDEN_13072, partial [Oesophagostomum dentatum]
QINPMLFNNFSSNESFLPMFADTKKPGNPISRSCSPRLAPIDFGDCLGTEMSRFAKWLIYPQCLLSVRSTVCDVKVPLRTSLADRREEHSKMNVDNFAGDLWLGRVENLDINGEFSGFSGLTALNQARFSLEEAIEVLLWVENVTGLPYASDPTACQSAADVAELLKDGVHLCKNI